MDPFNIIQQDINSELERARQKLETRDDMINDKRGINVEIFNSLGAEVSNILIKVRETIVDVDLVIQKTSENPSRFMISPAEIQNRIQFSKTTKTTINMFDSKLKTQNKHNFNQFTQANQSFDPTNFDSYGGNHVQAQEEHMDALEQLGTSVEMALHLGKEINSELKDQQQMLVSLEGNIDSVSDAMKKVTDQIKNIIENEGKTPTYLVAVLSIIFIVLLFFLI